MSANESLELRIRRSRTAEALSALILDDEGQRTVIMSQVAEHAAVLDENIVLAVLASGVGLAKLVRNPALPETQREGVVRWAINRLSGSKGQAERTLAVDALEFAFANAFVPARSEPWDRALALLARRRNADVRLGAALVLASHPDAPEDALLAAFAVVRDAPAETQLAARILTHPAAPASLLEEWAPEVAVWSRVQAKDIRHLADSDRTRRHPAMRQALARYARGRGVPEILARLAADAMDDCAEYARDILTLDAIAAPLRVNGPRIMDALGEEERLALLQHEQREVRLAAIAALQPENAA